MQGESVVEQQDSNEKCWKTDTWHGWFASIGALSGFLAAGIVILCNLFPSHTQTNKPYNTQIKTSKRTSLQVQYSLLLLKNEKYLSSCFVSAIFWVMLIKLYHFLVNQ